MPKKQSDTLSNQNINTALLISTFTADQDYDALRINVFIDNIVGNGDYSAYVTHQKAGAGTAYKSATTTDAVDSGVTDHRLSTLTVAIEDTDVIKVYLIGLAGDNVSAVDIITEYWFERWDYIDVPLSTLQTLGAGSEAWVITTTVSGSPKDGVDVWVTTDEAGTNVIARDTSDDNGEVTFMLDVGSYWTWRQLAGFSWTPNPQEITVTA